MPNPDTITVTTVDPIDSVVVSPNPTIDSVSVNNVQDISNLIVGFDAGITDITISDDPATLDVAVSIADYAPPVQSVNGKTGHVVIDYPDISDNPVNHVRYEHVQTEVSNSWLIQHNLNFYPNVTILDNDSPPRIIEADIRYVDANSVRINMNVSMSGTAYLT